MPTAVAPAGTSRTTTALQPILAPSPTKIGPSILAPAPITTPLPKRRVTLAGLPRGPAQRHPMVQRAIVADLRGFPDDDAHPVVDEHPAPYGRARMDLDAGQPPAPVGKPAGKPAQAQPPQPMRHPAVPDQRVQPGIAGQHFPTCPGGRIPVEHDGDVFAKAAQHVLTFSHFRLATLNYWVADRLINPGESGSVADGLPALRRIDYYRPTPAQGTGTTSGHRPSFRPPAPSRRNHAC